MAKLTIYEIFVPIDTPDTKEAFENLIEKNGHIFERFVMSNFRGDMRYEYQADSLTVSQIDIDSSSSTEGTITFEVDVQYFEGCKNKDYLDQSEYSVDFTYDRGSRVLKFELDETIWNPDN